MRIIVCDYPESLESDYSITINSIRNILGKETEIDVIPYTNESNFVDSLQGADGLITAFIPLNEKLLNQISFLKVISISASGYGNIDIKAATSLGITVCHIYEYCTNEVADHTMSLLLSLNKQLKPYTQLLEDEHKYSYYSLPPEKPLHLQKMCVFGMGKIGQAVAKRAQAFGIQVMTYDPFLPESVAKDLNVELISLEKCFKEADIITNHMLLTDETEHFFNKDFFAQLQKEPIFINVGRGVQVVEADLVSALDKKQIRAAGLDVLTDENPNLENHPLLNRPNVLLTPHCAFYSTQSIYDLQFISATNLAYALSNNYNKVTNIVKQ